MRILLSAIGCCLTLLTHGQTTQESLHIQLTYEKAGRYLEQAIATIQATNILEASTVVEYRAGQSVTMLPGFEARMGTTFVANIEPVGLAQEGQAQLRIAAYPNPFEHSTIINYYLPSDGKVNLWITDTQGRIVRNLVQNESQSAGNHQIEWKATSISSGIYLPVIEASQQKAVSRLIKK